MQHFTDHCSIFDIYGIAASHRYPVRCGFLIYVDEIVAHYIHNQIFPYIILVDESITYGRALNSILLEREQALTRRFEDQTIRIQGRRHF